MEIRSQTTKAFTAQMSRELKPRPLYSVSEFLMTLHQFGQNSDPRLLRTYNCCFFTLYFVNVVCFYINVDSIDQVMAGEEL